MLPRVILIAPGHNAQSCTNPSAPSRIFRASGTAPDRHPTTVYDDGKPFALRPRRWTRRIT